MLAQEYDFRHTFDHSAVAEFRLGSLEHLHEERPATTQSATSMPLYSYHSLRAPHPVVDPSHSPSDALAPAQGGRTRVVPFVLLVTYTNKLFAESAEALQSALKRMIALPDFNLKLREALGTTLFSNQSCLSTDGGWGCGSGGEERSEDRSTLGYVGISGDPSWEEYLELRHMSQLVGNVTHSGGLE